MAAGGRVPPPGEQRTAETPVASTVHEPVGNPAGPGLWHHKGMQLPAYIQHVANHLRAQGHSESSAVQMAVGIIQNWAAGHDGRGNKVHADVQAAAAKAVAEWEALKAAASGGAKRFNPFHLPAGPAGGEFTHAGGGGGGAGGKAPAGKGAAVPPPAGRHPMHRRGESAARRELLQRAQADREQARGLEQELHTLEAQLAQHHKQAAAAKHQAAAAKQAGHVVKHRGPVTHHHAARRLSLQHRIVSLRARIGSLLAQAAHLEKQAAGMRSLGEAAEYRFHDGCWG
jgi:hypothetical protein